MEKNKLEILHFIEEHKNELMIEPSFDIVKLVGFHEDMYDYYYVIYGKNGKEYMSCVGKLIPLNGVLNEIDYEYLVRVWEMNRHIWAYEKVYENSKKEK